MPSLQSPLTAATTSTFEGLGFLLANVAEEGPAPSPAALPHGVRVGFRGPRTGRVELRVSDALLGAVAANMLGLDVAPDAALRRDALGELANVIAGNLVPALDGPRAIYLLDAPAECAAPSHEAAAALLHVAFDEGEAEVRVYIDVIPQACPERSRREPAPEARGECREEAA